MPGKSIRVFLIDGTASGLRTAEIGLSTIKALVVPRASLSTGSKRPEVQRTGVYVLIGGDTSKPGTRKVYVGEGDVVLRRLTEHNKDPEKDFWDEAVVLVSKDENLTKAHVRYLEARLITLAHEAKRCTVANGTEPPEQGRLPEADTDEMEAFITQARLLLGTLGYDVFEPASAPPVPATGGATSPASLPEFTCSGDGFEATCAVDLGSGQFVVRSKSRARKAEAPALPSTYKALRSQLIENGVLADQGPHYEFTQDYAFSAITAAAQVVSGTSVNGRTAWKTAEGKTFAEWQDEQLPDQDASEQPSAS